jgi:hypothetical protein
VARSVQVRVIDVVPLEQMPAAGPYAINGEYHFAAELLLDSYGSLRCEWGLVVDTVPGLAWQLRLRWLSQRVRAERIRIARIREHNLGYPSGLLHFPRHRQKDLIVIMTVARADDGLRCTCEVIRRTKPGCHVVAVLRDARSVFVIPSQAGVERQTR